MELQQGYARIYYKGAFQRIEDFLEDEALLGEADRERLNTGEHVIWLLISRMSVEDTPDSISRLLDSAETAFYEGDGECRLMFLPSNIAYDFSTRFEADGIRFEEPSDNMFSFNSPLGACPTCEGSDASSASTRNLSSPTPRFPSMKAVCNVGTVIR